jgi:hypothetical protein
MNSSDAQRLYVLRGADKWRQWRSLDDERLCIECAHSFTGHEVVIAENGEAVSVRCPTLGCKSTPRDWFYHGQHHSHVLANLLQLT